MKTIHISYGGPDRKIRDATGKVWRFEMHPYCGPAAQDAEGELLEAQPGPRSLFWEAVTAWARQGAVIGPDGFCAWKPSHAPETVHLGGKHYALASSKLAKEHRRTTP